MNQDAKKTALRLIPYGIYVLTADDGKGNVAGATVNWLTQTAFNPPLVVAGIKFAAECKIGGKASGSTRQIVEPDCILWRRPRHRRSEPPLTKMRASLRPGERRKLYGNTAVAPRP